MKKSQSDIRLWVFGYGSLIWRPAMNFEVTQRASVTGWARRFWQGSHDHRGTIEAPGRVLTLVPMTDAECFGRVFGITQPHVSQTLQDLDYREKNGYQRQQLTVLTEEFGEVEALTYIAPENNLAWLGDASLEDIVRQVYQARGPSGSNKDYVLELQKALLEDGISDEHISAIAHALI